MERVGQGWQRFVALLILLAAVSYAEPVRADCEQSFLSALDRLVRRTFDLRRDCEAVKRRGGTCSIQSSLTLERQRFAAAIRAGCTRLQLVDLGPGGCAAEAAQSRSAFLRCTRNAVEAHVQRMLAPIFGLGAPGPSPTVSGIAPTPTARPTASPGQPTPTPGLRCARLNEPCFGPGISGCCASFTCKISGVGNLPICTLRGSPGGAFLDGLPAAF